MYVILDTKIGEYFTKRGDWIGIEDNALSPEANVFPTAEEADQMIDAILRMWDKRYPVPPKEEYQVRKVRPRGWILDE